MFLETFNKEEIILVKDKAYNLIEIDEKEANSKEFDLDIQEEPKKERKIYRPQLITLGNKQVIKLI